MDPDGHAWRRERLGYSGVVDGLGVTGRFGVRPSFWGIFVPGCAVAVERGAAAFFLRVEWGFSGVRYHHGEHSRSTLAPITVCMARPTPAPVAAGVARSALAMQ